MIIGDNRPAVIENIRRCAESGNFHAKVELNDPVLTDEQSAAMVQRYLHDRGTGRFKLKTLAARRIANVLTALLNRHTELVGAEKAIGITGGAILTSNHFSPVENTGIRHLTRRLGRGHLTVVSQLSNLAMPGFFGFLMNYADIVPMSDSPCYMRNEFVSVLSELLDKGEYVLIYPEQEMWFNYRKPRPLKRGAYYYAARLNVPVICCFIEQHDLPKRDTDEFRRVRFTVRVLEVLYPDPTKTAKENSVWMCERDYALKAAAYEEAYGKPLTYAFDPLDIAGWMGDTV